MNYHHLLSTTGSVKAGLIGVGDFGRSFLAQARHTPGLDVSVICDREIKLAWAACLQAGLAAPVLAACSTRAEALAALEAGKIAVVEDPLLLIDLPVEVVVEATGMPEAGAQHAQTALEQGKHVVMVSKETEAVVGPALARLAAERGLVYTPGEGDQPSLLIGLISWAETLGLPIICAGKASEHDFVYNPETNIVSSRNGQVRLPEGGLWPLWNLTPNQLRPGINRRREALAELPQISVADLCEMAIVINATGYDYDTPRLHAPLARIAEMADLFAGRESGGILERTGVIDVVNCLRREDEVSFAGGVFLVVTAHNAETWRMLQAKGHLVSHDRSRALIFRPYHLLGVETPISVLLAGLTKLSTYGPGVRPRVDLVARTLQPLPAGQRLAMERNHAIPGLSAELAPAGPMRPGNPIPFYMAAEHALTVDVPAGTLLTYEMVDYNPTSSLAELRRLQDRLFEKDKT